MLQAQQNFPQLPSNAMPVQVSAVVQKPWYIIAARHFNKLTLAPDTIRSLNAREMPWSLTPGKLRGPVSSISHDFYTQHFGFFCRQELRLEKVSRLPLRFRLGSLKDCNILEGK